MTHATISFHAITKDLSHRTYSFTGYLPHNKSKWRETAKGLIWSLYGNIRSIHHLELRPKEETTPMTQATATHQVISFHRIMKDGSHRSHSLIAHIPLHQLHPTATAKDLIHQRFPDTHSIHRLQIHDKTLTESQRLREIGRHAKETAIEPGHRFDLVELKAEIAQLRTNYARMYKLSNQVSANITKTLKDTESKRLHWFKCYDHATKALEHAEENLDDSNTELVVAEEALAILKEDMATNDTKITKLRKSRDFWEAQSNKWKYRNEKAEGKLTKETERSNDQHSKVIQLESQLAIAESVLHISNHERDAGLTLIQKLEADLHSMTVEHDSAVENANHWRNRWHADNK